MKPRDMALAAVMLLTTFAVTAPDYAGLGNRIEPLLVGLPFSLMWNVGWVGVSFVALAVYHLSRKAN